VTVGLPGDSGLSYRWRYLVKEPNVDSIWIQNETMKRGDKDAEAMVSSVFIQEV
jgi:hypothetical protein